ncbi:MAG: methyltransferase domain-containing protein [Chloroflexi bacterium]|nr:methyltransferase domain-containing protein [Chloroflexota bacterium]
MTATELSRDQRPEGWSGGARGYAAWFAPLSSQYVPDALQLLRLKPGERLLDIAAGTGTLTLGASDAGIHVTAVDFAPGMVQFLRERLREVGVQSRVEEMDGQALAFGDGEFHAACSMFGLIFFPDLAAGAREMRRVVRPGGRVLVAVWDRSRFRLGSVVQQALREAVPELSGSEDRVPASMRLAEPARLEALLVEAGLREVALLEVTHDWVVRDPVGLFRSLPTWAAPHEAIFERLEPAQLERASARFAEAVAQMATRSGGLPATALFGHGIR